MVDNVSPVETEQVSPPVAPPANPGRSGFFATDAGKIIIAAVAVFVLLIVSGIAAFLFFLRTPDILVEPIQPPGTTAPGENGTQPEEALEPPAEVPLAEMFVFRNIFAPGVKAPAPPRDTTTDTTGGGGGGTDTGKGGGTASVGANVLLVQSIQTQDGELTATVVWNDNTYTLSKGDTIPGSPWKMVDITESAATFIYGDSSPITLPVGTSISK